MRRVDGSVLQPADILLSRGRSDISTAVCTLDGGQYSHAAVWSGSTVIESTTPRVVERSLDQSLAKHPSLHLDVYRHRGASCAHREIVAAARHYVGRSYGYGDLALVGLLVATSKWLPGEPSQIAFLLGAGQLHRYLGLDRESRDKLVTCVELVVRAFLKAGVAFAIKIEAAGRLDAPVIRSGVADLIRDAKRGPATHAGAGPTWPELQAAAAEKYRELLDTDPRSRVLPGRVVDAARGDTAGVVQAGPEWSPNLVTPRQLETSPDLQLIGRLYEDDKPARRRPA